MLWKRWCRFSRNLKNQKKSNIEREKYNVFFPFLAKGGVVIKKAIKFIADILGRISKDHIGAQTAHAAFFVTVSFVPFLMLLISMIKFVPIEEGKLLEEIVSVFPKSSRGLVETLITDTYSKSDTALMSITAITTLWAASIGVFSLVRGLNRVFCADETRNFIIVRIVSMFYTLLLMALFILCLTFFVFGNTITEWIAGYVPWLFSIAPLIRILKLIIGVLVLSGIFLGMFKIIPNRKTKLSMQLPGALIAGVGWVGFSDVFSWYFESVADFSIYSTLSILVFFMLWLFVCVYILYIGAEVNKYFEDAREYKVIHK